MSTTRQVPLLIAIGIGFSWLFAAMIALFILFAVTDAVLLGGVGHYSVNEREVSPAEFLFGGAPVLIVLGAVAAALGLGLGRHRPWSRFAVVGLWLLLLAFNLATATSLSELAEVAISIGPIALFTWWYFFRKGSVLTYFASTATTTQPDAPIRHVGVTLLAVALAWLSFAGFANAAVYLTGFAPTLMSPMLAPAAVLYGATAALAAFGLWGLAPWAPRAFVAWSASVLASLVVFGASTPAELILGGGWGLLAFAATTGVVLVALNRYVRAACTRAP